MTSARVPVRPLACRGHCRDACEHPAHHDRLLGVDTDVDAVLELLELAVTWHELDWSDQPVVGPDRWLTFAAAHRWRDPERAARVFGLAADIVGPAALSPVVDTPAALSIVKIPVR